jgi:hypothetical protein
MRILKKVTGFRVIARGHQRLPLKKGPHEMRGGLEEGGVFRGGGIQKRTDVEKSFVTT